MGRFWRAHMWVANVRSRVRGAASQGFPPHLEHIYLYVLGQPLAKQTNVWVIPNSVFPV